MKTKTGSQKLADQLLAARNANVSGFQGIAHRLELVTSFEGTDFINDSKSTDIGAAEYSLENIEKPVVWILGESSYEEDYESLKKLVTFKVVGIVAYGNDVSAIRSAYSDCTDFFMEAKDVQDAVKMSQVMARSGDAVLFSPACDDYDSFKDYKARGFYFKELVQNFNFSGGTYDPKRNF